MDLEDAASTLRPLVALGQDREEAIRAVVEGWLRPVDPSGDVNQILAAEGTLRGVSFHDANTDQPIDLGELVRRVEERLGPYEKPDVASRPDPAIRLVGCRVYACDCSDLIIRPRFIAPHTDFANKGIDSKTGVPGSTWFRGTRFGDEASFFRARFGDGTSFRDATFVGRASFIGATFDDRADFPGARFGDRASFVRATFGDRACFSGVRFGDRASFVRARFGGDADFRGVTFGDGASFRDVRFGNRANFGGAKLGDVQLAVVDWRRALVEDIDHFGRSDRRERWRQLRDRWVDWGAVRALGNLQVLTRASYATLIVVPLLAGLWPGVRIAVNQVNRALERGADDLRGAAQVVRQASEALAERLKAAPAPPGRVDEARDRAIKALDDVSRRADGARERLGVDMLRAPLLPWSWALAFFASVFVAAAHTVYQVFAPRLVRERDRDDVVRERREAFREDGPDRDDQIRRAFDALAQIAERLPHDRHRNLVRRHGRVVWLPSDLDFLHLSPRASGDDDQAAHGSPPVADGERMRVVIDEGARAEYDLSAREKIRWAWVAGGLYAVGGLLILWILLIQCAAILSAATGYSSRSLGLAAALFLSLAAVRAWASTRQRRPGREPSD